MIQDDNSWQLNRHCLRTTSISPLTCLRLALVMILVASSVTAWAGKVKIFVKSSPSTGGYVYANSKNENNISTLTADDATSSYQVGGSVTMYRYAKEKEGYEFRGWADTDGGTPTSKSTNVSLGANIGTSTRNYYFWAIFSALPKFYFQAVANTNNSTYGNAYVTFTESSKTSATTTSVTTNCYGEHYNSTSAPSAPTAYFRAVKKTGYVFKGWSTSTSENDIFSTDEEYTYSDFAINVTNSGSPASITYYAIFGEKFAPQITGSTNVQKEVGDSYTADFEFRNTSTTKPTASSSNDFYYTIDHSLSTSVNNGTAVISYDPKNNKVTALNAGTATITFHNNGTATHQKKDESFTVVVTKKEPSFNCSESAIKVGATVTILYSNTIADTPTASNSDDFYYVITNNTPTTNNTVGSSQPTKVITFANNVITAQNEGAATITFYHNETYMYSAASQPFTVTVTKNNNWFKYSWNGSANKTTGWNETLNLEDNAAFTYSTENTITTPTINQTAGNTPGNVIATYKPTQNKITTTYNTGDAVWTLHQDENYKYFGADATLTVNVDTKDCPTCYVYKLDPDKEASKVGTCTLSEVGAADKLTFDMKKKGAGPEATIKIYVGGSLSTTKTASEDDGGSYHNHSLGSINANTTEIEFGKGSSDWHGLDDPYINTIRVSRKNWFKLTNTSGAEINELPNMTKSLGGSNATAKFKVDYSTCDDKIKIVSNHPHIEVSPSQISIPAATGRDGGKGVQEITVTYKGSNTTPEVPEAIDAIITVYTKYENKTLRVHAEVEKKNQTITWGTAYAATTLTLQQGLTENNAATASSELPITYRSGNESIIKISADSLSFEVIGTGNTTLIAVQKGDTEFKSVSSVKSVIASNKKSQIITWSQNLTRGTSPGQEIPLTAKAIVVDVVNQTQGVSNERTARIQYECLHGASDAVAEIFTDPEKGKCVRIKGYGETTIKATLLGDDAYEDAIPVIIPVNVPKPQNGKCDTPILNWSTTESTTDAGEYEYFEFDTDRPESSKIFAIDRSNGEPGYLSFYMRSVHYGLLEFWQGTFDIYQSTDNGLTFNKIDSKSGFKPDKDSQLDVSEVPLDRNATHFKIVRRQGGVGYHFLGNIEVARKVYIETDETSINLGNIAVGESREVNIPISYSSVKGNMSVSKQYSDNGLTTEDVIYAACGDMDTYELPITIAPKTVGPWSNRITIMDEHNNTLSLNINLTANATQGSQVIVWNPTQTTFYTVETAELEAQLTKKSNRNLDVTYSSSNNSVVKFSGSTPIISGNGNVTIYADCGATSDYKAAEQVSHNFTINRTPTQIVTAPTIDGTIYAGTSAENVVLNTAIAAAKETIKNNSVEGSYSITSPATLNAGTYDVTVTFTPSNINLYAPSTTTIENVTVVQNTPTPEQASLYADHISYGQLLNEAVLHNDGVLAGTWTWVDEDANKEMRDAGTYHNLNVHFEPENPNYEAVNGTVSVTVDPVAPTGYSATAASIMAGQPASASEIMNTGIAGSWAWVNPGTTYPVAGTYDVAATFTPENTNYHAVETTLSLTVTQLAYIFTGIGDWDVEGNWTVMPSGSEPDVIITGKLVVDKEITVGSLTIAPEGDVAIIDDGKLTIKGNTPNGSGFGDLYVANSGEVDVQGSLRVGDLTVEASIGTANGTAESGQVAQAENIVYTNAYIEIHMDPADVMDDTKWYGFTVPFAVNAHTGVSRKEGDTYRNCTYGSHYMIAEYDAAKRLTSGKGWKYLSGNTLNPGQFYFFTVNGNYNTYRFKASEAAYTQAAPATLAMNGGVENANANWNGVGNSTLRHATVSYTGGSYVQVYENGLDAYKTVATSEAKFVVGCPFFIQATEASTLVLDVQPGESERYYAPRRTSANQTGVARVNLTSVDGGFSDQIYVSATDREQDCYLAGHDLSKAGESKIVPQLWIDAYNQKLSVHELAWQGNEAYCAISLYAPQAGEYVLAAKQPTDGTEVYLTYNGQVLWNLTSSEYVLSLEKGTTTAYGLQIVKAPAITTGVDQIDVKDQTMRKVLMNDKIYIITPEGAMYDVLGKGVKF